MTVQQELSLDLPKYSEKGHFKLNALPMQAFRSIDFKLKKHFHKIGSNSDAERSTTTSRENTSIYYENLCASLFVEGNYKPAEFYRFKIHGKDGKELRCFAPDLHRHDMFGDHYVEVKSTAIKGGRFLQRAEQIENAVYIMLRKLYACNRPQVSPSFDVALSRYGDRTSLHLYRGSNTQLGKTLSENTRDFLILPVNLYLLCLSLSERGKKPNKDGYEKDYFLVNSSIASILHSLDEVDMEKLIKKYESHSLNYAKRVLKKEQKVNSRKKKPKAVYDSEPAIKRRVESTRKLSEKPFMHLGEGELVKKSFVSHEDGALYINGRSVRPFNVTVYSQRDSEGWWLDFRKHHKEITKSLRLRDLYSEMQEYRRVRERSSLEERVPESNVPF